MPEFAAAVSILCGVWSVVFIACCMLVLWVGMILVGRGAAVEVDGIAIPGIYLGWLQVPQGTKLVLQEVAPVHWITICWDARSRNEIQIFVSDPWVALAWPGPLARFLTRHAALCCVLRRAVLCAVEEPV